MLAYRKNVIIINTSSSYSSFSIAINGVMSSLFITAQCTLVQSAVLRSHVVHLSVSVRLSVTLVDCDHIGWKSWKLIADY